MSYPRVRIAAVGLLLGALLALSGCVMSGEASGRYRGMNCLRLKQDNHFHDKVAKSVVRVPVTVLTLGASEGSYGEHRRMEHFLGKSQGELIMAWGPPSAMHADPATSSTVLIYNQGMSFSAPLVASGTWLVVALTKPFLPIPAKQETFARCSFRVNKQGYVTDYAWRVGCY